MPYMHRLDARWRLQGSRLSREGGRCSACRLRHVASVMILWTGSLVTPKTSCRKTMSYFILQAAQASPTKRIANNRWYAALATSLTAAIFAIHLLLAVTRGRFGTGCGV